MLYSSFVLSSSCDELDWSALSAEPMLSRLSILGRGMLDSAPCWLGMGSALRFSIAPKAAAPGAALT